MPEAIATALPDPSTAISTFVQHPVTAAVVTAVQSTSSPSNWANTAAAVLQALMPIIQPAEQIAGASPKTEAEIAVGMAALSALLNVFFPHSAGS